MSSVLVAQTSQVLEFQCLFTMEIKKKKKRWQDGVLRFHTFNRRIIVYDIAGNTIGDVHLRIEESVDDGDELQLDQAVLVQVCDRMRTVEQDVSALTDRRRNRTSTSTLLKPIAFQLGDALLSAPRPGALDQMRPKSLKTILGGSRNVPVGTKLADRTQYRQQLQQHGPFDLRSAKRQKLTVEQPTTTSVNLAEIPVVEVVLQELDHIFDRGSVTRASHTTSPPHDTDSIFDNTETEMRVSSHSNSEKRISDISKAQTLCKMKMSKRKVPSPRGRVLPPLLDSSESRLSKTAGDYMHRNNPQCGSNLCDLKPLNLLRPSDLKDKRKMLMYSAVPPVRHLEALSSNRSRTESQRHGRRNPVVAEERSGRSLVAHRTLSPSEAQSEDPEYRLANSCKSAVECASESSPSSPVQSLSINTAKSGRKPSQQRNTTAKRHPRKRGAGDYGVHENNALKNLAVPNASSFGIQEPDSEDLFLMDQCQRLEVEIRATTASNNQDELQWLEPVAGKACIGGPTSFNMPQMQVSKTTEKQPVMPLNRLTLHEEKRPGWSSPASERMDSLERRQQLSLPKSALPHLDPEHAHIHTPCPLPVILPPSLQSQISALAGPDRALPFARRHHSLLKKSLSSSSYQTVQAPAAHEPERGLRRTFSEGQVNNTLQGRAEIAVSASGIDSNIFAISNQDSEAGPWSREAYDLFGWRPGDAKGKAVLRVPAK